jgi:hypothetical protein
MTAPIASGWSGFRVGLAPTGKRRLFTAHTLSGHALGRDRLVGRPENREYSRQFGGIWGIPDKIMNRAASNSDRKVFSIRLLAARSLDFGRPAV